MALSSKDIASELDGELIGCADVVITSVQSLDAARPNEITFITDSGYAGRWPRSRAGAAVVPRELSVEQIDGRALIRVDNVDLAVAALLQIFAPPVPQGDPGVHATAIVNSSAKVGQDVRIGAHSQIGSRAEVGDRVVIHANVVIYDDCRIGNDTVIWAGTVVRERCVIGHRCTLHPNVSIGGDGFGYRPAADGRGLVKIPQIGNVEIGHDVEIGSGSCIDRAKFGSTTIGDMTKIDNLVQIAHNCRIGRSVIIAGCCGIAGSVMIEDGAVLGGGAGVADHLTIGAGAKIAAFSGIIRDVDPGESVFGYPAKNAKMAFREHACMRRLPDLVKLLKMHE